MHLTSYKVNIIGTKCYTRFSNGYNLMINWVFNTLVSIICIELESKSLFLNRLKSIELYYLLIENAAYEFKFSIFIKLIVFRWTTFFTWHKFKPR